MKKINLLAICIIMIIFFIGCTNKVEVGTEEKGTLPNANIEEESIPTQEGNNDTENINKQLLIKTEIVDSEKIEDWNRYIRTDIAYTTVDWSNYSYDEENPLIKYSIDIPSNWTVSSTTFDDENGQKIAEVFPPIIIQSCQTLLDKWSNMDSELVSRNSINFGKYNGEKLVEKVYIDDSGDWFIHTFFLQEDNKVFAIFFYERELGSELEDLFTQIVETFEFIDYIE